MVEHTEMQSAYSVCIPKRSLPLIMLQVHFAVRRDRGRTDTDSLIWIIIQDETQYTRRSLEHYRPKKKCPSQGPKLNVQVNKKFARPVKKVNAITQSMDLLQVKTKPVVGSATNKNQRISFLRSGLKIML